jgi:hypothetical protein
VFAFSTIALADDLTGEFKYDGKVVKVSIGDIATNEKGKTILTLLVDTDLTFNYDTKTSSGPAALEQISKVIKLKIENNGKTYEPESTTAKLLLQRGPSGGLVFGFESVDYILESDAVPAKIIVFNDQGVNIVFDGKTKKIIK